MATFFSLEQLLVYWKSIYRLCFVQDYKNYHIPAFGSWDVNNDLPITQYFESARQAGLVRYNDCRSGDLYKVHDLQYRAGPRTVSHAKVCKAPLRAIV